MKGGLGSASATTSKGIKVAALVAVNALGSATVGDSAHFWAAPFEIGGEFGGLGLPARFSDKDRALRLKGVDLKATTIGVIVTDATLTKAEAHRLSIMAHDGFARALLPGHLPADGDTVFAAATGRKPATDFAGFMELCHLATQVSARAVARGVFEATSLPYPTCPPSWKDRFG